MRAADPINERCSAQEYIQAFVSIKGIVRSYVDINRQYSDTLKTVAEWVEKNRTDPKGPFALMTNFPKKTFSGDALNITLLAAGTLMLHHI